MQKKISKVAILRIVLASLALVCFFAFLLLVINGYNFKIDNLNIAVSNNRSNILNNFFKIFTYLGSFYVLALISIVVFLILYFVFKQRLLSLSFLACFTFTSVLNLILKHTIQRPRPENLMIIEEMGFAFPSGHAMMSLAVFGFFIYLALQIIKNKPAKICLSILFFAIIILVGFSRIYLGVHYVSDVLAGWFITYPIIVCFVCLYNYLKLKKVKHENKKE